MIWYDNLRIGKSVGREKADLLEMGEKGEIPAHFVLITIAANPANMLEIRSARELRHGQKRENMPMIIAVAGSRSEALSMLTELTEECLKKTGDVSLREYLGC